MASRTVVVASASGLHARPAKVFVREAARLGVPVRVRVGQKSVPAGSMLGVLSLGAVRGTEVTLEADGPGAEEALDALAALLSLDLDAAPPTAPTPASAPAAGAGDGGASDA
ncbi:HPr family phosphocarrier protein [Nonomuraea spiralis]|uniref:HPr family phosphocarrier protein n=1 Tax=Nonomuraea TaxID=83681 RepID=UPI000F7BABF0|nr:HPr family phosphocarrier protein [Nonomuraea sp. WAC 01424]RSN06655.1 HPr family phosphocarrier protein [Nonomuraea sp. WAC 01424]